MRKKELFLALIQLGWEEDEGTWVSKCGSYDIDFEIMSLSDAQGNLVIFESFDELLSLIGFSNNGWIKLTKKSLPKEDGIYWLVQSSGRITSNSIYAETADHLIETGVTHYQKQIAPLPPII